MAKIIFLILLLSLLATLSSALGDVRFTEFPPSTAKHAAKPRPRGCLSYSPATVTLEGRLAGFIIPGGLPDGPSQSEGFLYLWLDPPISICGNKQVPQMDSYVNVTRIGLGIWSLDRYLNIMQQWGRDQVRIDAELTNSGMTAGQNGPIVVPMDTVHTESFKFCYRKIPSGKPSNYRWRCLRGPVWMQKIKNALPLTGKSPGK